MEQTGTRPRKSEEEKQMVQERWKRGGNLCTSYTEFTAIEEIPERNKATRFKIKVGEKAGVAIKKLLQRSDPFKTRKCERGDCPVCRVDGKGPCDRQSATYDIKYAECNDIYIGQTSRSTYTRGK